MGSTDLTNLGAFTNAEMAFSYQEMPISYQKQRFSYHFPSR